MRRNPIFGRPRIIVREDENAVLGYNLEQQREPVRARLAYFLLVLLALDIIAVFLGVMFHRMTSQEAKDLLAATFPSIVALVGAATGFYYATAHGGSTASASPAESSGDSISTGLKAED